jgi:hypothetical protein
VDIDLGRGLAHAKEWLENHVFKPGHKTNQALVYGQLYTQGILPQYTLDPVAATTRSVAPTLTRAIAPPQAARKRPPSRAARRRGSIPPSRSALRRGKLATGKRKTRKRAKPSRSRG